jgi:hypothetical protein
MCADCSPSDKTCALDAAHHEHVANVFSELPTELVLAQIVGICTRLSSHICGLSHSDARTNVRALQDCVDRLTQACDSVAFAVADWKALETALHLQLASVGAALHAAALRSISCSFSLLIWMLCAINLELFRKSLPCSLEQIKKVSIPSCDTRILKLSRQLKLFLHGDPLQCSFSPIGVLL